MTDEYDEDVELEEEDLEEGEFQELGPNEIPSYEEIMAAQRITMDDIKEHVTGPVVSVIVHIILLALLGTMVVFEPPKEKEQIEVEVSEVDVREIQEIPDPPEPPEEQLEQEIEIEIDAPQMTDDAPTEVSVDDMAVEDVQVDVTMPDLNVAMSNSALKLTALPSAYVGRTGEGRKRALKTYGGSLATEKAVRRALDWLVRVQNDDGSWGNYEGTKPAFTALALLCFLAHGENPSSAEYGPTVLRAIKRLVFMVDDMVKRKRKYVGTGRTYNHAMVAYALSEAYGITKMPRIRDAMDATIKVLINGMNKVGSYNYNYHKGLGWPRPHRDPVTGKYPKDKSKFYKYPQSSLSFAGWNYQALKAAFAAGCDVEGLGETLEKGIEGLKYHFKNGGFGDKAYQPGHVSNPDFAMTSVGVLCMGLLGEGNSKEAKSGWRWLREYNKEGLRNCSWQWNEDIHKKYPKAFTYALYTWYYQTQVLFQATKGKGPDWKRWNRSFSNAYVKEQEDDGHWSSPAQKYGLSGKKKLNPKKNVAEWTYVREFRDERDLNIYATTMCCLGLEVYYRYLPTYKLVRDSVRKRPTKIEDSDLDLVIE